ncbi:MAG: BsaWI family type II restriction enzyme [Chloroflexota bacterium]|nr:BsaWI family type II restriction enzyme [Chloroflexota bacterium]
MTFDDLVELYEEKRKEFGADAYKHVSELLKEAKEIHKKDWLRKPTPNNDHEQSWKGFKGNNLEKLIIHIIQGEIEGLGLKIVRGNTLERTKAKNLTEELSRVKRAVSVDYGEWGLHLPDADIIIYDPASLKIVAILSSKSTLRERIAETGYWKIKLSQDQVTKGIKVFFVTTDEDGTLTIMKPAKKGRAIVEVDTDGSYVMSETLIEESNRVKMFDKFIDDLEKLIDNERGKEK